MASVIRRVACVGRGRRVGGMRMGAQVWVQGWGDRSVGFDRCAVPVRPVGSHRPSPSHAVQPRHSTKGFQALSPPARPEPSLRQPCAHTSESTGDRRRVKTWRDGERTDGSGLKSRVMEYADTVHFHVESTPVLPKPDEYQKQSTSSPCRLSSAVDLLQHHFKRCFTCNILALRHELESLSTTVGAE